MKNIRILIFLFVLSVIAPGSFANAQILNDETFKNLETFALPRPPQTAEFANQRHSGFR